MMHNNPYARPGFGNRGGNKSNFTPGGGGDDEDDIYSGYNDLGANTDIIAASVAQGGARPSFGMTGAFGQSIAPGAPGAPQAPPTASGMRPPTVQFKTSQDQPRPMTSVKGAGYTSAGNRGKANAMFDPLQQAQQGPAPPLVQKTADSPEHQAKEMEKQVNRLLEESAAANGKNQMSVALDKAKEAGKKERLLCRHREKNNLADQINFDLTYAVLFNLAQQYHANNMLTEALNTFSIVVKNKQYPQAGRLRVNMGNIYYQQKKYPSAIKMYRMAMDQIGQTSREMRFKIMRNIGNSFVRLGQFQDAIQSYEAIMDANPDAQTGFNLILCYYALGDKDKMKKGFMQLLGSQDLGEDEDEDEEDEEERKPQHDDALQADRRERHKAVSRYIHTAAKLIAPLIEKDMSAGFDWIIEYLKAPRNPNSPRGGSARQAFPKIAMEMEIAKGIAYLKKKDIAEAINVFKEFEKKDQGLIDQAATNLSFLYFLEGDYKNSEKYAELAVRSDRYNAKALVNKANYLFVKDELESAKDLYLEAIGVEADCVEAIYNLGLANKRLGHLEDALQAFKKLHRIIPKDPQVIYHIANLYELTGDNLQAAECFKILHGAVPTDPKVLARLGHLYNKEEDETQAFHNFSDSYNVYPVNTEVISWLGIWYVKSELYEDAIQFFERAAEIEADEVKWKLMVASCYRRMGAYQQALVLYKKIHKQDPSNAECLRYLCSICKDMNDKNFEEYSRLLRKAERAQAAQENRYMHDEVQDNADLYPDNGQQQQQQQHQEPPMQRQQSQQSQQFHQPPPQQPHDGFGAVGRVEAKQMGATINQGHKKDDTDDWGDDDLDDDLLPI